MFEHPRPSSGALLSNGAGPRSIVVVGAGFSGTALAINLLRRAHRQPLRIILLERAQMARGVAYAKRGYPYLLNVPAGRMSANSGDPTEFLAFARRLRPHATADDFLPRELYGDYLEATLRSAEAAAPPHVELRRIHGQATDIDRSHRSHALHVHLSDGRKLSADIVVLACGNPPPALVKAGEGVWDSRRYVEDPWQAAECAREGETILVVGTGLTAADAIVAANHAARGKATFHAISRHGLLSPPQARVEAGHFGYFDSSSLSRAAAVSLRSLVREIRVLAEDIQLRGGDWRQVIGCVRDLAPTLWQRLPPVERRRFLRHVRSYWDVHRHRLPESTWNTLNGLRRSDQLFIHSGRIASLKPLGRRIRVTWRPRGGNGTTALLADRLINCTGPDYDVRRTREPLLRGLVSQGVATADPLGLGLITDESGALIDRSGRPARNLYYLGPMLRATYWETTAVVELRDHAARLAQHLTQVRDEWRATVSARSPAAIRQFGPLAAQHDTDEPREKWGLAR
jgi:uncharacterized NAD(P)/FAD-binding protein YdhS